MESFIGSIIMVETSGSASLPLLIVTGLSGAGKSTVLKVFEDLGFFTVDGLPALLASQVVPVLNTQQLERHRGLVLGMDLRQHGFHNEVLRTIELLKTQGYAPSVLFLEASHEVIVRRYKETRRPHPLETRDTGLEQAMAEERHALEAIRNLAALVIDTSAYSIHDVRRVVQQKWRDVEAGRKSLRVHVISFGFKYGVPAEADSVFDLRFLPNPYHERELRPLSGKDSRIADYVLGQSPGKEFLERLQDFLQYVLVQMEAEGRYRMTVGVGCTGGRHRSVATAEALYSTLKQADFAVSLEHRHLNLG